MLEDPELLAPHLRDIDKLEVKATSDHGPLQALTIGLIRSRHCWSVVVDGEVSAMFGVADFPADGVGGALGDGALGPPRAGAGKVAPVPGAAPRPE